MTTPITAVVQGFRKYAVFGGRATRAEYWWWLLFTFIGSIVFIVIDSLIGFPRVWEYGLLETLFWLATLLPSITVVTRRLHDIGKTGWWQVPWYGILFVAWLATGMFIVALVITYGVTNASGEWSFDDADIQWESAGSLCLPAGCNHAYSGVGHNAGGHCLGDNLDGAAG